MKWEEAVVSIPSVTAGKPDCKVLLLIWVTIVLRELRTVAIIADLTGFFILLTFKSSLPQNSLVLPSTFFYPNRIFFFYPNKVLRLTYPLWQHWMTWVFTVGFLHVYLVQLIATSKIKSKGNKIQDQIQSPFNANLHLSPQILIRKTEKQQLPQLLTTR